MISSNQMRCCLQTPDPRPWAAGADDTADPAMVKVMHKIRDTLSYDMPISDLIWALKAAVQIDNRTMLGGDIQRCLLSNAAHRLEILAEGKDPAPWRTLRARLKDAWAIVQRRGVCIRVRGRE